MHHFLILANFFRGKTEVRIPDCLTEVNEEMLIAAHDLFVGDKGHVPGHIKTMMSSIRKVSGPLPK